MQQYSPVSVRRVKTDLQTSQLNLFTRQSCRTPTTTTIATSTNSALPVPKGSPSATKRKVEPVLVPHLTITNTSSTGSSPSRRFFNLLAISGD